MKHDFRAGARSSPFWIMRRRALAAVLPLCLGITAATSDANPLDETGTGPARDVMIVFDASGSMWGQIAGRTKIEIAREALSTALTEISAEQRVGLMAYGHRSRGQCGDIETLVALTPADEAVPKILATAGSLNPRGMTPLTDSVRRAAQALHYSEQAATVLLITDGIENCAGDPCALGRELASSGVDFTAHVVGFDLSDAEQQQVACLATETGGQFLAANNAGELSTALRHVLTTSPSDATTLPEKIEPQALPRAVEIMLRDTHDGEPLNARAVQITIDPQNGGSRPTDFRIWNHERPITASGTFEPGRYTLLVTRQLAGRQTLRHRLEVDIPAGDGVHTIDEVIAARLRIQTLVNASTPLPETGRVVSASAGDRTLFEIMPIVDGVVDPNQAITAHKKLDLALAPGLYFLRGALDRSVTRQKLIAIRAGETLDFIFDFDVSPVVIDMRDRDGFPPNRPSAMFSDRLDDREHIKFGEQIIYGRWIDGNGQILPFHLPPGLWRVDAGPDNDAARRAHTVIDVAPGGAPITLTLTEGQKLDRATPAARAMREESHQGCLADEPGDFRCTVEVVTPLQVAQASGLDDLSAEQLLESFPFQGSWYGSRGWVHVQQQGDRLIGVREKGRLEGVVSPDARIARGVWDNADGQWGLFEFTRISGTEAWFGRWGRGADTTLSNGDWHARRVSAATPRIDRVSADAEDAWPEATAIHRDVIRVFLDEIVDTPEPEFPSETPTPFSADSDSTGLTQNDEAGVGEAETTGTPNARHDPAPAGSADDTGPAAATPDPTLPFAHLSGVYTVLGRGVDTWIDEPEQRFESCFHDPATLYPDGLLTIFGPRYDDVTDMSMPFLSAFLRCSEPGGLCEAFRGQPHMADPIPEATAALEVIDERGFRHCGLGECRLVQRCASGPDVQAGQPGFEWTEEDITDGIAARWSQLVTTRPEPGPGLPAQ